MTSQVLPSYWSTIESSIAGEAAVNETDEAIAEEGADALMKQAEEAVENPRR